MTKIDIMAEIDIMADANHPCVYDFLYRLLANNYHNEYMQLANSTIRGIDLYVLYNDLCGRDLKKVVLLLGKCPQDLLENACSRQDYSGRRMVYQYLVPIAHKENWQIEDINSIKFASEPFRKAIFHLSRFDYIMENHVLVKQEKYFRFSQLTGDAEILIITEKGEEHCYLFKRHEWLFK